MLRSGKEVTSNIQHLALSSNKENHVATNNHFGPKNVKQPEAKAQEQVAEKEVKQPNLL